MSSELRQLEVSTNMVPKLSNLPVEVWTTINSFVKPDDRTALSLAGLPGSCTLHLSPKQEEHYASLFSKSPLEKSVKRLSFFQRRLCRGSKVYRRIKACFSLESVNELVFWHIRLPKSFLRNQTPPSPVLNINPSKGGQQFLGPGIGESSAAFYTSEIDEAFTMEDAVCLLLHKFPEVKSLELDTLRVVDATQLNKAIRKSSLERIFLGEVLTSETIKLSSTTVERLFLKSYSSKDTQIKDCPNLILCLSHNVFATQTIISNCTNIMFLELTIQHGAPYPDFARECPLLCELSLKCGVRVPSYICYRNRLSSDEELDLASLCHLKFLKLERFSGQLTIPPSLMTLILDWMGNKSPLPDGLLRSFHSLTGLCISGVVFDLREVKLLLTLWSSLEALSIDMRQHSSDVDLQSLNSLQSITLSGNKQVCGYSSFEYWLEQKNYLLQRTDLRVLF